MKDDIKIFFAAKTDKKEIRGFVRMDSITPEKLEDMKMNGKNYIGKIMFGKNGKLYRVIGIRDTGFECEELG